MSASSTSVCLQSFRPLFQQLLRLPPGEGVEELINEFSATEGSAAGYLACIIAILYLGSIYSLEKLGPSTVWKAGFRGFLADYAYVVSLRRPLGIV